jgi:hypothetical protein
MLLVATLLSPAPAQQQQQPPQQQMHHPPQLPVSAIIDLHGSAPTPPQPSETLRVAAVQTTNFDDGVLRSATQEISHGRVCH